MFIPLFPLLAIFTLIECSVKDSVKSTFYLPYHIRNGLLLWQIADAHIKELEMSGKQIFDDLSMSVNYLDNQILREDMANTSRAYFAGLCEQIALKYDGTLQDLIRGIPSVFTEYTEHALPIYKLHCTGNFYEEFLQPVDEDPTGPNRFQRTSNQLAKKTYQSGMMLQQLLAGMPDQENVDACHSKMTGMSQLWKFSIETVLKYYPEDKARRLLSSLEFRACEHVVGGACDFQEKFITRFLSLSEQSAFEKAFGSLPSVEKSPSTLKCTKVKNPVSIPTVFKTLLTNHFDLGNTMHDLNAQLQGHQKLFLKMIQGEAGTSFCLGKADAFVQILGGAYCPNNPYRTFCGVSAQVKLKETFEKWAGAWAFSYLIRLPLECTANVKFTDEFEDLEVYLTASYNHFEGTLVQEYIKHVSRKDMISGSMVRDLLLKRFNADMDLCQKYLQLPAYLAMSPDWLESKIHWVKLHMTKYTSALVTAKKSLVTSAAAQ